MDGFTRVRLVGKGSFGAAYLVTRKKDGKSFIEKEVRMAGMPPAEQEAAKKEVQLLRAVDHPNIVRYVDHCEKHGTLHIVMEYADGGDLYTKLKKQLNKRLPEKEVMMYFTQLCLALKHLHEKRILHRDLKTQNVFLTSSGVVKLGDFGISTVLKNTFAVAHTICGTPYYFSPELCQNKPYNNKTDVWSLGCILYELTTLTHAFDGANMKALMQKIIKGVFPPIPAEYSPDLRDLINKMLSRDPNMRPNMNTILTNPYVRRYVELLQGRVEECQSKAQPIIPQKAPVAFGGGRVAVPLVPGANPMAPPPPAAGVGVAAPVSAVVLAAKQKEKELAQRELVKQQMAREVQEYDEKIRKMKEKERALQAAQGAQAAVEYEDKMRKAKALQAEADEKIRRTKEKQMAAAALVAKEKQKEKEMDWERNMRVLQQEAKDRKEKLEREQQQMAPMQEVKKGPQDKGYNPSAAREAFFNDRRDAEANKRKVEEEPVMVRVPSREAFKPKEAVVPKPPASDALDAEKRKEVFWQNRKEAEANKARLRGDDVGGKQIPMGAGAPPPPPPIVPPCVVQRVTPPPVRPPVPTPPPPPPPVAEPEPLEEVYEAPEQAPEAIQAEYVQVLRNISEALKPVAPTADEDFEDDATPADSDALVKFTLDGHTLHLPNVRSTDPLGYRIEVLRQFLETKMGDAFLVAFRALDRVDAETSEEDMMRLEAEMGAANIGYMGLVSQLILCVDEFNAKQQ